jgi:hypothetical protein
MSAFARALIVTFAPSLFTLVKIVKNGAFEGCGEALTPVTILVVLVARKEMHRERDGGTGQRD